jgi:hypothetical protein
VCLPRYCGPEAIFAEGWRPSDAAIIRVTWRFVEAVVGRLCVRLRIVRYTGANHLASTTLRQQDPAALSLSRSQHSIRLQRVRQLWRSKLPKSICVPIKVPVVPVLIALKLHKGRQDRGSRVQELGALRSMF